MVAPVTLSALGNAFGVLPAVLPQRAADVIGLVETTFVITAYVTFVRSCIYQFALVGFAWHGYLLRPAPCKPCAASSCFGTTFAIKNATEAGRVTVGFLTKSSVPRQ